MSVIFKFNIFVDVSHILSSNQATDWIWLCALHSYMVVIREFGGKCNGKEVHTYLLSYISIVDIQLSLIQPSRILIQLAKISEKTYSFYKVIQKQICSARKFMHHVVVFPATSSCATYHSLLCRCHNSRGKLNLWLCYSICIKNLLPVSQLCLLERPPPPPPTTHKIMQIQSTLDYPG
jgi:hypothetical protein